MGRDLSWAIVKEDVLDFENNDVKEECSEKFHEYHGEISRRNYLLPERSIFSRKQLMQKILDFTKDLAELQDPNTEGFSATIAVVEAYLEIYKSVDVDEYVVIVYS